MNRENRLQAIEQLAVRKSGIGHLDGWRELQRRFEDADAGNAKLIAQIGAVTGRHRLRACLLADDESARPFVAELSRRLARFGEQIPESKQIKIRGLDDEDGSCLSKRINPEADYLFLHIVDFGPGKESRRRLERSVGQ